MTKPRILAVDDERDVRLIIKASLEPDFEVFEAQDGLDALEKIGKIEPDLVILDVMMPLMDGYDTCISIKKNPRFAKTPVMFLSALTEKDQIKRGYISGANLYLTKPFEPERLKKNIDLYFKQSPTLVKPKRFTKEELMVLDSKSPDEVHAIDMATPSKEETEVHQEAQAAAPKYEPATKQTEAAAPRFKVRPRVMVIDDDENIFDYILLTLRDKYEVVWAQDGFQAVEKIVTYEPDILLLDIMIPKVSGYQLCSSIRKNKVYGAIPIIMISAKGEKRDIDYGYRMGANSYLVKPFEPQQLIDTLSHFITQATFQVKPKKIIFSKLLELEHQSEDKYAGEDAKYMQKIDEAEKKQHNENM